MADLVLRMNRAWAAGMWVHVRVGEVWAAGGHADTGETGGAVVGKSTLVVLISDVLRHTRAFCYSRYKAFDVLKLVGFVRLTAPEGCS